MKKALMLGGVVLVAISLGGCPKIAEDACAAEITAHGWYVAFVAPFRPVDRVALELQRYNTVMALCSAGASPAKVDAAKAKAAEVRAM